MCIYKPHMKVKKVLYNKEYKKLYIKEGKEQLNASNMSIY